MLCKCKCREWLLESRLRKRPSRKNKYFRESFAHPGEPHVYLSRGCIYPLLCCWDALKQHANGNCVSDPGDSQGYICKAMLGNFHKIPPGNSRVSLFTTFAWLAAAKVPSGLLASMDILIATVFAELSRNFRKKTFAHQPTNPHPESWLGVQLHLIAV